MGDGTVRSGAPIETSTDVRGAFERALGRRARRVERLARGYANVTWLVETEDGRYLLKAPPQGAPRVERTVRATAAALAADVPTPRIVHQDTSGALLPPHWIQEYVEDAEDAERLWRSLSSTERDAVARAYGAVVARLHATPHRDDPRPLANVVASRLASVVANAREVGELDEAAAHRVADAVACALPLLARVEPRLCHTDLHLENVLLTRADDGWRFAALLDFEHGRATDPAEDFPKLGWWNFGPHPEMEAPFLAAYGDPSRHGVDFAARRDLFCLYGVVASLGYFARRAGAPDPVRPYVQEDNRRQLALFRERFRRWLAGGAAC